MLPTLPGPRPPFPHFSFSIIDVISEFFECFDFVSPLRYRRRAFRSREENPANEIFVTNRSFLRNLINGLPKPIVKDVAAMRNRLV